MFSATYLKIVKKPIQDRSIRDAIYLHCFDALLNGASEEALEGIKKDLSRKLMIGMFTINVYCNQAIIDFNIDFEKEVYDGHF